ncbi:hypothetical protein [Bradyrhizobium valentinum]|uniref:hypothetical protein n=1 Tax=Bradyrhizobium valentinum TaxID=1518501 RepID=UPI001FDA9C50|nr:hypothetical protein [Bradyrhizobium valentinum]
MTKNGHPRCIPLTPLRWRRFKKQHNAARRSFRSTNAVRLAWERLRARSGLPDLRLHDLRHEAVSRFFELGLSSVEVAGPPRTANAQSIHPFKARIDRSQTEKMRTTVKQASLIR